MAVRKTTKRKAVVRKVRKTAVKATRKIAAKAAARKIAAKAHTTRKKAARKTAAPKAIRRAKNNTPIVVPTIAEIASRGIRSLTALTKSVREGAESVLPGGRTRH